MAKTHYNSHRKSDHLNVAELEEMQENGIPLIFKITRITREYGRKVAGRKVDGNFVFFDGDTKPLMTNKINDRTLARIFNSKFLEDWNESIKKGSITHIELYIDKNVRNPQTGEIDGGVRISQRVPKKQSQKEELSPEHPRWAGAKQAIKDGNTTISAIKKHYTISPENEKLLCG